ncbi:Rid family detoxifying hydrolase [Oceanobacillus luteolus]|uniref:RidA family protein n=1 Tax=Oceanobacillus luteolus TaxID=1274358 RepID=UPI0020409D01|nr:Rid family detoxifying hydrolase [Oceanobacillus luteolus]MCM3740452.1 Rid family detoxifying hydrolase [Oceanobacillus luteolus]
MRKVYTAKDVSASGPYSHAVDAGEYIYFSGQTAKNRLNPEDSPANESITSQTEQCFKHLTSVLEEVGLTEDNVVKVNVYLTSMKHFDEMNRVYETFFQAPYPARTCVAVYELPLGADVEIELVAKR